MCVRYGCGCGGMAGRYECRIVSSFAKEIVATPQNYSITHERCGMSGIGLLGVKEDFDVLRHGSLLRGGGTRGRGGQAADQGSLRSPMPIAVWGAQQASAS